MRQKQANKKITGKTRIVCNMIWYRIQREDVGGGYKTWSRTETLQIFSRSQYVEHELCGVDAARLTAACLRNRANSEQSPHQFLLPSYQYFKLFCERQVCTHAEKNIQHMQCVTAADLIKSNGKTRSSSPQSAHVSCVLFLHTLCIHLFLYTQHTPLYSRLKLCG